MALDIDKLIADAQAARAAAEAKKAAADKAAAALKLSTAANRKFKLEADNKLNYANALATSLQDFEGKLTVYANQIARDGKLDPVSQKEFDRLLTQYKKTDKVYTKTVAEVDKILAAAPSPTKTEVKGGKVQIAPTAEEKAVANAGATPGATTQEGKPEDFAALLKTSTKFIKDMSGPDRKLLAQSLNDSLNLNLPVSELVDPGSLLAAYNGAITAAQARYKQFGDILSVDQFLNQKKLENGAIKAAGGSGVGAGTFGNIYDPTQAKSLISNVITSVLGRDATDKEVAKLTKQLQTAQAKNPYKKNAQGMTVGGLNAEQYITDLVKALPEYEAKTKAKQDLTAQSIENVMRANGLSIDPAQVKSYSDRVKNGEDIKTIESQIRFAAGRGLPEDVKKLLADGTDLNTVYDPYRRVMATSLGITPDSITLDDPTLRMAIGPDKEMSLYDFKKAVRQDNRWKYSQEANDEVTSMINQVKRDFGFMG